MKKYILDTSVLLHEPTSIYAFEDNKVIILSEVWAELDKKKSSKGETGKNARDASREIEEILLKNDIEDKIIDRKLNKFYNESDLREVKLDKGKLLVEPVDLKNFDTDRYMDLGIIKKAKDLNATIVTKDRNLRIMAKTHNVNVEDYKKDKVKEIYKGHQTYDNLTKNIIDDLHNNNKIEADMLLEENEYINLKAHTNNSGLGKHKDGYIHKISKQTVHSITPKNKEQTFAMDALMDKDIELLTLTGVAGTGKTLLALAAGLQQVVENKDYRRVLVARPTVTDNDIGYLPGGVEEKLRPWMQPIYDNIDFIYQDSDNPSEIINQYKDTGQLEIEPLAYIRGRSISNQFFIIDEAQNLTPKKVKTIISRAGENCKIVLTGDVEQIDHLYLDKYSNGLSNVVNNFKGEDNYAHITLTNTERSRLAEQAANLL